MEIDVNKSLMEFECVVSYNLNKNMSFLGVMKLLVSKLAISNLKCLKIASSDCVH